MNKLAAELRTFCDPEDDAFSGYPTGPSAAASRWSDAFDAYVQDLVVIAPSTVVPPTGLATLSGVAAAFRGPLTFAVAFASDTGFATELSSAWQAGMGAIVLGSGAVYAGTTTVTTIDPLPTTAAKATLFSALLALFQAPAIAARDRADAIAQALHTATTTAGATTCTIKDSTSGTSTPSQALTFG